MTPDGRLATVVNAAAPAAPRKASLKVPGKNAVPLASYPAPAIAQMRPITKDPFTQKLPANSPARKSLGATTAGEVLVAIARLPEGTRVRDERTGRTGVTTKFPIGGGTVRLMTPGIRFDGDKAPTPLDGFTGDLARHLTAVSGGTPPPLRSGFVEVPPAGLIESVLDKVKTWLHRRQSQPRIATA